MENVFRKNLPTAGNSTDTYFIISDLHSYHLHLPTFDILLKHAKKYLTQPKLIINGDLFDLPFMMKKNEGYRKWIKRMEGVEEFFLPEWEYECAVVNSILDHLLRSFEEVIFLGGNHDCLRISEFLKEIPCEYREHFSLETKLNLLPRGIQFISYGNWLDIGRISVIHGQFHNKQAHKSHHELCGRSVIFGHIHKAQRIPFRKRGKTEHVWSLPCMCGLSPDYIRKRETDWDTGYGILNVRKDGRFSFNLFDVWNDSMILPTGEIINGTAKKVFPSRGEVLYRN